MCTVMVIGEDIDRKTIHIAIPRDESNVLYAEKKCPKTFEKILIEITRDMILTEKESQEKSVSRTWPSSFSHTLSTLFLVQSLCLQSQEVFSARTL